MVRHVWTICLLALGASIAPAQEVVDTSVQFDWQGGFLELDLTVQTNPDDGAIALHRARQLANQVAPGAIYEATLPILVDSRSSVQEMAVARPSLNNDLIFFAESATADLPRPKPSLGQATMRFRVEMYPDLARLFVDHTVPFRLESVYRWVPTRNFTGIVIYAAEPIDWHGMDQSQLVQPAILPEIYDTNLRPVLQIDMMEPDYAVRWGPVAYTESTDEAPWRERIGRDPMYVMAQKVYGVYPTDILIDPDDADRLLANDHNRQLLRQGRVLVILSEQSIHHD